MDYQSNQSLILQLLKQYGTDSLSYFHLQNGREYFFSPDHTAFLSYKIYNKVALVSGDPVGPTEKRAALIRSFIEYCKIWELKVCFISISEELKCDLININYKIKRIGEEAVIYVESFNRNTLKKRVRRAVRHIEELGIEFVYYSSSTLPSSIRNQLVEISNEWLMSKGKKEKGFSMTLKRLPDDYDTDCIIAVAQRGSTVLGFSTFMPIYKNAGFSLDLMRKSTNAPNGLNEFLIIKTIEYLKRNHFKVISLNFATFVYTFPSENTVKTIVSKMLASFFKCKALYSFNNKFQPVWKTRYLFFPDYRHLPSSLLAIIQAER